MFGKFFASTFTGSMYGAGSDVFAVWGYVIANTIRSQVELNPVALAGAIGITPERAASAIEFLCAPDPRSRSKVEDGRRIVREGEFAYRVPNHEAYRAIRDEGDRRSYNREKQRAYRERKRQNGQTLSNPVNSTVIDGQSPLPNVTAVYQSRSRSRIQKQSSVGVVKARHSKNLSRKVNPASDNDAASKRSWLEPIAKVWHDRYGKDTFPFKQHAKALAELYRRKEPMTEVARRLGIYLDSLTSPKFINVPNFVHTYGAWAKKPAGKKGEIDWNQPIGEK